MISEPFYGIFSNELIGRGMSIFKREPRSIRLTIQGLALTRG